MTTYERIFGTGPRGLLISLVLLAIANFFEIYFYYLQITNSNNFRYSIFSIFTILTISIILWSLKSLPPTERGKKLITNGAFKYFRHPLYGAFLSFFNFGLAIFLNNWIYLIWALIQHPVWHWNIKREERLMKNTFPNEYKIYYNKTGRFFPRFIKQMLI